MGKLAEKIYSMWEGETTRAEQIAALPALSPSQLEALTQLATPTSDGYVISKQLRSELVDMGLVARWDGINFSTQDGYVVLMMLGALGHGADFTGGPPRTRKRLAPRTRGPG